MQAFFIAQPRMTRVLGRTDDKIIINGVNVYPMQIEAILFEIEGTEPRYRLIVDRVDNEDKLTLQVEVVAQLFRRYEKPAHPGTFQRRGGPGD